MQAMFVILSLMFLILGVAALLLRDKEDKHKDVIIPIQGTRFKGNI